jgi:hypothetical protein
VPLVACPVCQYRNPVRTAKLTVFNQCLRCTTRFVPDRSATPTKPPTHWARVTALAGALVATLAGVAWLALRTH